LGAAGKADATPKLHHKIHSAKRNSERFPEDFMFQLSKEEAGSLRFHFGILMTGEQAKSSLEIKQGRASSSKTIPTVL